jgi:protocatechuate 3,4-dioxygenase beta subunit
MNSIPAPDVELVVVATEPATDLAGFVHHLHRRLETIWPRTSDDADKTWQLTVAVDGSSHSVWRSAQQLAAELAHVVAVRLPLPPDRRALRDRWASSPAGVVAFVDAPTRPDRADAEVDQLLAPLLTRASLSLASVPALPPAAAPAPDPARSGPTSRFDFRLLSRRAALLTLGGGAAAIALAACSGRSSMSQAGSSTTNSSSTSGPATTATTATSTAAVAATAAPTSSTATTMPPTTVPVTLAPEMTEGPYYLDLNLVRSNVVEDRTGVPLTLNLVVVDVASGRPVQGAVVDIWHTDGNGLYSGFIAASTGGGGPPGGGSSAGDSSTFLRGTQLTDTNGKAVFNTIYPGWYRGRTVHIHVKVHVGGRAIHTGQFFFDDNLSDAVYAASAPYSSRPNRDTRNANDSIYSGGGAQSTLPVQQAGTGYTATMAIGVATT